MPSSSADFSITNPGTTANSATTAATSGLLGPQAGYVQVPRFSILLNGKAVAWPLSMDVTTNNYSEAARWTVSFANTIDDAKTIDQETNIGVEVQVSLNGGTPVSLVYGYADNVEYNPIHSHMTLTGRDLAALMLDSPLQQPFENMTPTQILDMFVGNHASQGLKGLIANTTGTAGRFYGTDYDATKFGDLYRPSNEWSMAMMLAQGEGYDLRIGGQDQNGNPIDSKTLYFGPPPPASSKTFAIVINPGPPVVSNAEEVTLTRALTLAKDVKVTVIAWNSLQMRPIVKTLTASNVNAPKGGNGPVQNYTFRMPGDATPDQALKYAQMKLRQVSAFERVVEVTVPGELDLTPSNQVKLSGTGTGWDQTYFIDRIDRKISFEEGFRETIRLKNHSPYNVTAVV